MKTNEKVNSLYIPREGLVKNLKDILHHKKKGTFKDAGGVSRMKAYNLNKLFQGMADLTFFFEAVKEYDDLQEAFEADIKELLGITRLNPRAYNYAFIFMDLVGSIVLSGNRIGYDKDFRTRLLRFLKDLIIWKLQTIPIVDNDKGTLRVLEDIQRAGDWIDMVCSRVNDDYDLTKLTPQYEQSELIKCKTEKAKQEYKNKVNKKTLEDFENYALQQSKPARTIMFDTKKLLEFD